MEETWFEAAEPAEGVAAQPLSSGPRIGTAGLVCDIQRAQPYRLAFENATDVICLLFGSIDATTSYDGARPRRMRFEPMTIAWHPAGGRVAVTAERVSGGFAAITYGPRFADVLLGDAPQFRPTGSVENIASPSIAGLVSYARNVLEPGEGTDQLALEMVAGLAYLEAARAAGSLPGRRPSRPVGRRDIARVIDRIEADLEGELTHAELAGELGVPMATLARSFRGATGQCLHRFVLDRRIARAREMLSLGTESLVEIACACGFSSQAHMTSVFTRFVGTTPGRYRAMTAPESVKRRI